MSTCYVPGLIPSTGATMESNRGTTSALKEFRGSRGTEMSKWAILDQRCNEWRRQGAVVGMNETVAPIPGLRSQGRGPEGVLSQLSLEG